MKPGRTEAQSRGGVMPGPENKLIALFFIANTEERYAAKQYFIYKKPDREI